LIQRFSSSVGDSRSTQIGWNLESSSSASISSWTRRPLASVPAAAGHRRRRLHGKTNTLAHRVADIPDPLRSPAPIRSAWPLLATFSRGRRRTRRRWSGASARHRVLQTKALIGAASIRSACCC
jgi:hypothetical protein